MSSQPETIASALLPNTNTAAGTQVSASHQLDWALLVLPGLIWGASFLFIAQSLEALPPDGVTFLRLVIGFLTLSLVPEARRPVLASDHAGIAWLGVLWRFR